MVEVGQTSSPFVSVFSLGGTIAMGAPVGSERGSVVELDAADLMMLASRYGEIGIDVETHDFRRLPSAHITFADLFALKRAVDERIAAGAVGVVVTQGTDTIEETCWFIDVLHDSDVPIVFTGAMRAPTAPGADGPANLIAAIRVACTPDARGSGAFVVFNDEIHAARDICKMHSASPSAFVSPNGGPLGYVVEDVARILRGVSSRVTLANVTERPSLRVALYVPTIDDAPSHVLSSLSEGCDGLVVAGFGAGHVPLSALPALERMVATIPVVLCTRTGSGPSLAETYSYPGSEKDLLAKGLIRGGFLHPYKARILLYLLMCSGAGDDKIRQTFAVAGRY